MEINQIYAAVLFVSTMILVTAALYAWRLRKGSWGGWLSAILICVSLYSAGYAFELLSLTLDRMLLFLAVEYAGISLMPPVIIMMALAFSDKEHLINKKIMIPVFTVSAVTFIIHVTARYHNLFYIDMAVDFTSSFPVFTFKPGIWYYVHNIYLHFAILILFYHLIMGYLKKEGAFRSQIIIMLAGSMFPWVGHILYLSGYCPHGIDTNPMFFSITAIFFSIALFKYRLLDLLPVARERVIESLKDGIIIIDNHDRIVDMNRSASEIFSGLTSSATGLPVETVFKDHPEIIKLTAPPDYQRTDIRLVEDGIIRIYEIRSCPVENKRGVRLAKALIISDITLKAHLLDRLKDLASHDELTRSYNRRHFLEMCENEITRARRYSRPLSILFLDIDFFKKVNDNFGHAAGDDALIAVSEICKNNLRQTDIFGRYGGEEFAALLPETQPDKSVEIAERLRGKIEGMQFFHDGKKIDLTVSIGVAGINEVKNESIDSLLKNADKALYHAKASGRNRVHRHE
jgi:diguanylate cyclase (GGDEF)-like protein